MAWRDRASDSHAGFFNFLINIALRFCQFVLALVVIGLYGGYVNDARIQHKYADPNYVFAVVVGSLAAVTSLILAVPFLKMYKLFPWDIIMFILWIAVFGVFGKMFIHENPEGDSGIQRMKNAVWIDLVNAILWLLSALHNTIVFFTHRGGKSLYTGRADVQYTCSFRGRRVITQPPAKEGQMKVEMEGWRMPLNFEVGFDAEKGHVVIMPVVDNLKKAGHSSLGNCIKGLPGTSAVIRAPAQKNKGTKIDQSGTTHADCTTAAK